MRHSKRLVLGAACLAAVALLSCCVWQVWVFVGPYEDEPAMRRLDELGVGYGRHPVNSPIAYWAGNVSSVTFTGEVDREKMDLLLSLKHPKFVAFSRCTFAEKGLLLRVAEIRSLRTLYLWHDTVTDDDLVELLPQLTTVEYLYLNDNPITDGSIDAIASMPRLKAVMIQGTTITDEGKARLRSLRPKLRVNDVLQPPF